MAAPHDIDSKHISEKIATQVGCAAMLTSSAKDLQEVFDAYNAMKEEAADWKSKYEAEKQRADKEAEEKEYWKKLALDLQKQPKVIVKGKAKVKKLVTGNVNEYYAEDNSNQGQQHKRVSAGREALPLVP